MGHSIAENAHRVIMQTQQIRGARAPLMGIDVYEDALVNSHRF